MGERTQVLALFKKLMRASRSFTHYNFREYALRRVRLGFREKAGVSDPAQIAELVGEGSKQLEVVRKQALISQLYPQARHVMEGTRK
ncbi:hypothetical protein KFE25_003227 [Diacronema lutheri]|uniref:Complex 1 LYR protein domain-containing protein n=1 Tax=Diacronema lutheri TaxID=2081491 RepID=A0A8J5XP77_DIALT|nr:hypothetical protein KFE25_003227 [Diacronema lutheri]